MLVVPACVLVYPSTLSSVSTWLHRNDPETDSLEDSHVRLSLPLSPSVARSLSSTDAEQFVGLSLYHHGLSLPLEPLSVKQSSPISYARPALSSSPSPCALIHYKYSWRLLPAMAAATAAYRAWARPPPRTTHTATPRSTPYHP